MKTTLYDIYKSYKHCEDISQYNISQVYSALKKYLLQVVLVDGTKGKELWNYTPEIKQWHQIM